MLLLYRHENLPPPFFAGVKAVTERACCQTPMADMICSRKKSGVRPGGPILSDWCGQFCVWPPLPPQSSASVQPVTGFGDTIDAAGCACGSPYWLPGITPMTLFSCPSFGGRHALAAGRQDHARFCCCCCRRHHVHCLRQKGKTDQRKNETERKKASDGIR
jgi:hypothetical protein